MHRFYMYHSFTKFHRNVSVMFIIFVMELSSWDWSRFTPASEIDDCDAVNDPSDWLKNYIYIYCLCVYTNTHDPTPWCVFSWVVVSFCPVLYALVDQTGLSVPQVTMHTWCMRALDYYIHKFLFQSQNAFPCPNREVSVLWYLAVKDLCSCQLQEP